MADLSPSGAAFSELLIGAFRLNGLALAAGDRLTAPAGLTSARWQVMGAIEEGGTTVPDIARTMGLTRQSVRETAEALARAGLVTYVENPRHRTAKLLQVTATGRRALRAVERRHAVWASRLGAHFPTAALRVAIAELRRACTLLEADE